MLVKKGAEPSGGKPTYPTPGRTVGCTARRRGDMSTAARQGSARSTAGLFGFLSSSVTARGAEKAPQRRGASGAKSHEGRRKRRRKRDPHRDNTTTARQTFVGHAAGTNCYVLENTQTGPRLASTPVLRGVQYQAADGRGPTSDVRTCISRSTRAHARINTNEHRHKSH